MDLKLAGKVAPVTGASVGLGGGIAQMLAEERMLPRSRGPARRPPKNAAEEIAVIGCERPLVIVADITQHDAATRIRDDVVAAFGRLDILVNNAGGSRPFDGLGTRQQWDEAMALNFMPVGNSPMPSYP
ncbi:SDR family NAD(P)-dependent oxidoreductase [Bradyrhizobium sp. 38]|jgi:3-oxoacyl-[acyl-carrier protein] reductase|uniref:SDR family NAD(P)-dependent oxidoreductase n=2 Tax=Bradyrhizobium TaxID=374 RepID=UPI001FFBD429|nr:MULTISPECIES: SDR family NAD(P)-dependent oxidoreductase [unclassified Bradyrhizobium]MCK1335525.1 SDR family NAD(P)-dependent oxidoreductase [Bradyrhizobium sp. 38]MCK1776784.1 SDR family NAD(P)-dependent oxidoreductase [Bradyrhizobium sp. 132]